MMHLGVRRGAVVGRRQRNSTPRNSGANRTPGRHATPAGGGPGVEFAGADSARTRLGASAGVGRSGAGDADGFVGGFEGLLFGFLLFVVGTLLVATPGPSSIRRPPQRRRPARRPGHTSRLRRRRRHRRPRAAAAALIGYGRDPIRVGGDLDRVLWTLSARHDFGGRTRLRC